LNIVEFRNGVAQTNKPLNGFYEVTKKRDQRKAKFTAKYWKLLDFTAHHMPEGMTYTVDLSNATKEFMHLIMKQIQGVDSVSHQNMSNEDFKRVYSNVLDHCCQLLKTQNKTVIKELTGFFQ